MGRLLLVAMALFGIGIAMIGSKHNSVLTAPTALHPPVTDAAAPPAMAYRPGEPMLRPGQATELHRSPNGHFTASASVNGQPVDMLVDTGASAVALTIDDARRLGLAVDPATFRVVGTGASGPVRGTAGTLADVAVGDRHVAQMQAVVVEGLDRSLLGQSYLRRLEQVEISGDTMTLR